MAQKFASWLITESGKKFTFRLTCATTIGICAGYTIPQTMLLHKYKEVVQLYKSGLPVKLSQPILERYEKALTLLEIPEHERNLIKPFTVFGFDIFNAGTLYSKFGGIIGIPVSFTYKDEEFIEKSEIMVNNESVNWSMESGEQLLNSLILSENAQLFAIAREVLYLNSMKLMLDTFYATSVFILMYGIGTAVNKKYNLHPRPLVLRLMMYSIVGVFGFGLYSFLTDYTQNQYDIHVDQELCKKNPIFVEGGKEFYEKIILRNVALRNLMGRMGEKQYSVMGNENFVLRQKRLPLIVRRDFFENKMKSSL